MGSNRRVQVWRISKESEAGIEVTDNSVVIGAGRANFIATHKAGVTIMGKSLNFGVLSENQRHGGLFLRMNDFLQLVPTTLVTPVPNQRPEVPYALASAMLKDLPFFIGMLSTGVIASSIASAVG